MTTLERETFLAERRTGLGGSDAGSLFDLPPYGCRRKLWYDKTGIEADFPFTGNAATERGTRLEPIVVDLLRERGLGIARQMHAYRVADEPHLLVHIDGIVIDPADGDDAAPGVLEVKCPGLTAFARMKREGLPEAYILQLQHGLMVTGWTWGLFAIFSAERWELIDFRIERDEALIASLRDAAGRFWRLVENGPAPDRLHPDAVQCRECPWRTTCQGAALVAAVEAASGDNDAAELPEDETITDAVRDYLEASGIAAEASELKQTAHDALTEKIGDRPGVQCSAGRVLYRPVTSQRIDTTALRKELPAVAATYSRPSVSRPLRVLPAH